MSKLRCRVLPYMQWLEVNATESRIIEPELSLSKFFTRYQLSRGASILELWPLDMNYSEKNVLADFFHCPFLRMISRLMISIN